MPDGLWTMRAAVAFFCLCWPAGPDEDVEGIYLLEEGENRNLIEATVGFRTSGILPAIVGETNIPALVASQTLAERDAGKPVSFGGRA